MLREPRQMEPLFGDTDLLVFNGDTLETKYADSSRHQFQPVLDPAHFLQTVAPFGPKPLLIAGNHDPNISDCQFITLNRGRILITHGDGIFPDIAPWSSVAKELSEATRNREQHSNLHDYLKSLKQASLEAHRKRVEYDPTFRGKLGIFLHQSWPPHRVLKIFKAWKDMPEAAHQLARRFGLDPEVIIIGHTHNPGIARIESTWIINTGSFLPWPGALTVDIGQTELSVRRVRKWTRRFHFGQALFTLPLDGMEID